MKLPQLPIPRLDLKPDRYERRINRAPSPVFTFAGPWISVVLGSLLPGWLIIASAPIVPPLGFLILLAWRQVRPGILPIWSGVVLGGFDDLISGQPFGSAILLWCIAMLGLEALELRVPWRNFFTEWLVASGLITAYVLLSGLFANAAGGASDLWILTPQIVLSVLIYPMIARMIAWMDRVRLLRFSVIG